jgi:predicted RNase H-like HicB family nuclease
MTKAGMDKLIKEIMDRSYARVLVPDESGGYVAEVLELPGCISEGDTPDEAIDNLEDAMRGWLRVALEDGRRIPEPLEAGEYNGRILLRVPRSVHARCVRLAEADGVSLNQWLLEAIGERLGAEGFARRLLAEAQALATPGISRVAEPRAKYGRP